MHSNIICMVGGVLAGGESGDRRLSSGKAKRDSALLLGTCYIYYKL